MTGPDGFTALPVWTLDKRTTRLIAGERAYKGRVFFEVREWAGDGTIPTGKGVTMPPGAVESLARALLAYAEALALNGPENGS